MDTNYNREYRQKAGAKIKALRGSKSRKDFVAEFNAAHPMEMTISIYKLQRYESGVTPCPTEVWMKMVKMW